MYCILQDKSAEECNEKHISLPALHSVYFFRDKAFVTLKLSPVKFKICA